MTRKKIANAALAIGTAALLALAGIGVTAPSFTPIITECHRQAFGSVISATAHEGLSMPARAVNEACEPEK